MPGPGRKELRSLRLKAEATPGVLVAPRFVWRGPASGIADTREVTNVEEQVGIFGGTDRTYIAKWMAEYDLNETPATFEQLPDLLLMAGFGTAGGGNRAGSAQGASGSAVAFTLAAPALTAPVTYACTLEAGDDAWAEAAPWALANEIKLSFAGGEAMMVSAKLSAAYATATNAVGSFSNVGTLPLVEEILASQGSFWLSPVGSGWGTGAVTAGNILAGELTIKPTWTRKYPVDAGVLYPSAAVYVGMEFEGELTLESQISGTYGAWGSAGQKEKWRNEQPQLLTMTWRGGAIPEGTTYATKLLTIQIPWKWSEFDPLDDQDGNDIIVGKGFSKYNEQTPAAGRGTVIIVRQGTSEISGA